eukprot:jgi/Picsp_1/479/NSC_00477-R1_transcription initiation factor tfiid subunit 5-like
MESTSVLGDEEVDGLVLGWLKKRNLQSSFEILELELKARGQLQDSDEGNIWSTDVDLAEKGLVVSLGAGGDAQEYARQYRRFASWVGASLDMYQREISQLLYPVFVHCFVSMVQLEASTAAQDFLTGTKEGLLNRIINPSRKEILVKELHELSKLTVPEQFHTSTFLKAVRAKKVAISLSQYSFELLMAFLRQENLIMIISILNMWFAINFVREREVTLKGQTGDILSVTFSAASTPGDFASVSATDQDQILFDHLKEGRYLKFKELRLRHLIQELEEQDEEQMSKTKRNEHLSALEAARSSLAKLSVEGIKSKIPLPKVSETIDEEIKHDFETSLGFVGFPSCALITYVNSYANLNSICVSSNLETIVGGFADSLIRVYSSKAMSKTCSVELQGHTGPIYSTDLCPSSNFMLSSSSDGSIRLWSLELMSNLTAFTGHVLPVWDTCFLPELGYYFASGGADKTVRVWNTERKQPLRIMNGHSCDVEVIRWHPNYQILATGSSDNSIRIWDISSGSCVALFEGHKSPITSVEFAPNGKSIISGDSDGELKIWDLGSRQVVQNTRAHSGPIWSISHSLYDSTKFVTGGNDCTIHVWDSKLSDVETGSSISCLTWQTKATPVTFLRYHADNLVVAAGPMALSS